MVNKIRLQDMLLSSVTILASPKGRNTLTALLVLASVYIVATASWMLVPLEVPLPQSMPVDVSKPGPTSNKTIDIDALRAANWFGKSSGSDSGTGSGSFSPALSAAESQAVESSLRIDLIGVVLAENTRFSRAILNLQGRQESFAIGDVLPAGRAVNLVKVLSDRIIIDNAGRFEYINLYENSDKLLAKAIQTDSVQPQNMTANTDASIDLSDDEDISNVLADLRNKVKNDPNSLYQLVNISPLMEDGELKGYKLAPGSMRAEFTKLGLKDGDVLTSVNGMQLNSPQAIGDVMSSLSNGGIADLELLRGDNIFNISVSLDASQ